MPTDYIPLEEAYGTSTTPKLVPAKRAKRGSFSAGGNTPAIDDPQDHVGFFGSLAKEMGTILTSTYRTPEENRKVGGVKNSQHMDNTAADFRTRGRSKEWGDALIKRINSSPLYVAVDERNTKKPHIHAQLRTPERKRRYSASDIAAGMSDEDINVQAGNADVKKKNYIPLDEAYGPVTQVPKNNAKPEEKDEAWYAPVVRAGKNSFESLINQVKNPDNEQKLSEKEIDYLIEQEDERDPFLSQLYPESVRRKRLASVPVATDTRAAQVQAGIKDDEDRAAGRIADEDAGWWEKLTTAVGNPLDAIMQDSLPADIVKGLSRTSTKNRETLTVVREALREREILENPGKYPKVAVDAAKEADTKRRADNVDPSIPQMWDALKQAAVEDPATFSGQMLRALVADPYMAAAPIGLGAKPVAAAVKVATAGTRTAGRAIQLADRVIDAGALGAMMNVGAGSGDALATNTNMSASELKFAAGSGAVLSGALAAIFTRGARAKLTDLDKAKLDGSLEDTLRAQAAYEVEIEAAARNEHNPMATTEMQQRINDSLGITSTTDRNAWVKTRRDEVRSAFKNEEDYANYQAFKAEERMLRTEQLAKESAEKAEAAAAQAARASEASRVELTPGDPSSAVSPGEIFRTLRKPGHLRTAEEVALVNRLPKGPRGQGGNVDPELAVRLGLAGTGAAVGFALSDEDKRMAGGFMGALVGALVPGGGSRTILSRLRQSGAVSSDGNLLGYVLKKDKLPNEEGVIARAKEGNQDAFRALYEQYVPRLERAARSYLRTAGGKMGVDAADVAQDTMLKAWQNIESFKGDSEFYTWLHSIMRNEGLQTIRKASSRVDTQSMHPAGGADEPGSARAGHIVEGGEQGLVRGDVESAAADVTTPENMADAMEAQEALENVFASLPRDIREAVELHALQGMEPDEIAQLTGEKVKTIYERIRRGKLMVADGVEKRLGVGKGPKGQTGNIDPRLMKAIAAAGIGAGVAASFVNTEDKDGETVEEKADQRNRAMVAGAAFGLMLLAKGPKGRTVGQTLSGAAEKTLGAVSTNLLKIDPKVYWRAHETFRNILKKSHEHNVKVGGFLTQYKNMDKGMKSLIKQSILTGDRSITEKLFQQIGDPTLLENWKAVRGTLDSLSDQLVALKRFKPGGIEYFPRIVTDYPGLRNALAGKLGEEAGSFLDQILNDAEAKSVRVSGRALSETERAKIINTALMSEPKLGGQPNFAKNRTIEKIDDSLIEFYADPAESLHSYIRDAVSDIEKARFFGKDLQVIEKDGSLYTNLQDSVGTLTERLIKENKLTPEKAEALSENLKALFIGGESSPHWMVQAAKNLNYAGLLGNVYGAASQLGDPIIQVYTQGLRAAMSGLVRTLTNRKYISMKEFGLVDHIAEEFVNKGKTAKYVNASFKYGLFTGIDTFGKNVGLNAAISKGIRLSKSDGGIKQLEDLYSKYLTVDEMKQLVKDYQKGEVTDLVQSIAFAELSRTQPITKMEMPVAYLNNPNGRTLYQYKTFMLKQMDVVRRDFYQQIRDGHVVKGVKNLVGYGAVLGIAGMPAEAIKDYLSGKEVDLSASDIPMNMIKTFGMSEYMLDKMYGVSPEEAAQRREEGYKFVRPKKAEPIGAIVSMVTPAYKQFEEIVTGDPKAIRYVPIIGRYLYERRGKAAAEEEAGQ